MSTSLIHETLDGLSLRGWWLSEMEPALHVTTDSRRVRAASLFVALRGRQTDGHIWIPDAVRRGAVGVVGEDPTWVEWFQTQAPSIPYWAVRAARPAAARLTRVLYGPVLDRLAVMAVTGTKGKTTTVHWVQDALRRLGVPCARVGTLGMDPDVGLWTGLTTPEAPDLGEYAHHLVVQGICHLAIEASSIGLDQYRVDGLRVAVAAFTNLGHDHLDYHGDVETYYRAKLRLFDEDYWGLRHVIVYTDDPFGRAILRDRAFHRATVTTVGICEGPTAACEHTVHGVIRDSGLWGARGELWGLGWRRPLEWSIRLSGRHNVSNFLVAWAMAASVLPSDRWPELVEAMGAFSGVPGRMERLEFPDGRVVVIDYAHTPESLELVLRHLRPQVPGRLIVLFGCGGERDATKRPLMGQVAARYADFIILTDDNPRREDPRGIVADIEVGLRTVPGAPPWSVIYDRRMAVHRGLAMLQPGDCLLLAGKGHEDYQIYGTAKVPYSDRQTVLEWMADHVETR
ncbi:MAG: UDP-N-acetylmuramoyl-L-alanyl-D-glutamate--2,6-diaminopimelate ligase [Acidobacteria bacterium]|nr:UDP-N-acetylmuramoyl-L-alanyl-D-glutamate--2,6-diaminopimelate ligase [Acidobacteriota bacterium]